MNLHFRNDKYVEPPGCLTQALPHPIYHHRSVELGLFNHHRFAFFYWNKWTREAVFENDLINEPPSLITLDWHQDLVWPDEAEKEWLNELDVSSNRDVSLYAWANLRGLNDTHVMSAAYLNLIGDIYVHCRQGIGTSGWKDEVLIDKYGYPHTVKKFRNYEDLENHLTNSDVANIFFDIDLDFFTLDNPLNSGQKEFTYLSESRIVDMLSLERPLIAWMLKRLWGITIATELEHTGGLLESNRLLELLNRLWFSPSMFKNYGGQWQQNTNWKHLRHQ